MHPDFNKVRAVGVAKSFGGTLAVAHADLTLGTGTVTTLEGANGSGKSTLLLLLALLLRPTRGQVLFDEKPAGPAWHARGRIGLVAHFPAAYLDLTARENLTLIAKLHGISDAYTKIEALVERFAITEFADRPMRTYSRGQQQRVALARSILPAPRLLLLDEPTTGLDGQGLDELELALIEERERGAIIALATHDRVWARKIADHRVRLDNGKVMEMES